MDDIIRRDAAFRMMKTKVRMKELFFSILALHTQALPDESIDTLGVHPSGKIFYNPAFVCRLSDDELQVVFCHEILHLALLHLTRRKEDPVRWNIAVDLVVNDILRQNNYTLPEGCIMARYGEWKAPPTLFGKPVTIRDVGHKSAEQIYNELPPVPPKNITVDKRGAQLYEGQMDAHGSGTAVSQPIADELTKQWTDALEAAYIAAKTRGDAPKGISRFIDSLKKAQVNWKDILKRYITTATPTDYTWLRRSKRSVATQTYLPSITKEYLTLVVGVDLSGSIRREEMRDFLSEIVAIAAAYSGGLRVRVLSHDVDVHTDVILTETNINDIIHTKFKGGGGTSHKPIYEFIKKNEPHTPLFISFTDGYSDIEQIDIKKYPFHSVFVISKGGNGDAPKAQGIPTIMLHDNKNN